MSTATLSVSELSSLKASLLKVKLKTTWMSGDLDKIDQVIAAGGAEFIERLQVARGARVLDVACGTGNLSFPAARAGAIVTGVDIASNLLTTARDRAQAHHGGDGGGGREGEQQQTQWRSPAPARGGRGSAVRPGRDLRWLSRAGGSWRRAPSSAP